MADVLAMTNAGPLTPGKRVTLPSGAVWVGGRDAGTSVLTFPDDDPLVVDSEDSPNSVAGSAVRFDALSRMLQGVLGVMPKFVADWMDAGGPGGTRTSTRILRMSARTTFDVPRDPADAGVVADSGIADRSPIRRAAGGLVSGPGGSRDDSILARLSNGEYVVNAAATSNMFPLLEAINAGWVPSPGFLAGMLPGFAAGGLVDAGGNDRWRDLIRQNMAAPIGPGVTGADFGLLGLVGDAFGAIANGALNAGGRAGSMLGSALAPAFQPGGVVSKLFGATRPEAAGASEQRVLADGSPNPLSVYLGITPEGALALPSSDFRSQISDVLFGGRSADLNGDGLNEMARLAEALGQGIESVATEAGGKVGAALGSAIGPALGPSGALAPEIGAQLGAMIGSKFGGSLRASMTMSGSAPGDPSAPTDGGAPTGDGSVPSGEGPAASGAMPDIDGGGSGSGGGTGSGGSPRVFGGYKNQRMVRANNGDISLGSVIGSLRKPAPKALDENLSVPEAKTLEQAMRAYDPEKGSVTDFLELAGAQLGVDFGIGEEQGRTLGDLLGNAATDLDPNNQWSETLAMGLGNVLGIPFRPDQQAAMQTITPQLKVGWEAAMGAVQGLQQHGLVGGLTGAISGAASSVGGMAGNVVGTALAGFLGPLAPLGGAIGSAIGSMAGSALAGFVTQPIEYAANTAKELIGTGFGLTDLAEGPGGRTARQDIYNFNGMDPRSAAMAVERVNRRRTLAQQRGGGLGR